MNYRIKKTDLIFNQDGSIFHLHLHAKDIADTILLVGDPKRAYKVASFFDKIEVEKKNREFVTITGLYKKKRFTALSTGIGTDNIDIVVNELDAIINIDADTYEIKKKKKSLQLIRIGTSGALQPNIPINTYLLSEKSIGFDGLLNFYADRDKVTDFTFEKKFKEYVNWNDKLSKPYVVNASKSLNKILFKNDKVIKGVTISANGFYGPQGRILRLALVDENLNEKMMNFTYQGKYKITNYEMESSALFGLSSMLGHRAACVCLIIANRATEESCSDYTPFMDKMIEFVLNALVVNFP